jgi:hypothetical protein
MKMRRLFTFVLISSLCLTSMSNAHSSPNPSTIKLTVHYQRVAADYSGWELWLWRNSNSGTDSDVNPAGVKFTGDDEFGKIVTLDINNMDKFDNIGIVVRKGAWLAKDIENDRFISQFNADGTAEIWLRQGDPVIYYSKPSPSATNPSASAQPGTNSELLFKFNPSWDSTVVGSKIIGIKSPVSGSITMVIGFPNKIKTTESCADLKIFVAPVDLTEKGKPASDFTKKYANLVLEIWSFSGLKLAAVDSRGSNSFWAPSVVTQIPLKICDTERKIGTSSNYMMRFTAGIPYISSGELKKFDETLTVEYESTVKKTTITCAKGKLIKKVTAVKPVCPAGYKKK